MEEIKVESEVVEQEFFNVPIVDVNYGNISCDFSVFKKQIEAKANKYKSLVLTDDNVKTIKDSRALLNNTAKQLNDYRIQVEKAFNKPFEEYKKNCSDVIAMLKDASSVLDAQLKEYENKCNNEKIEKIRPVYEKLAKETNCELFKLEQVFNKKWLNKSYKEEQIKNDIELLLTRANKDIEAIRTKHKQKEVMFSQYVLHANYENIMDGSEYLSLVRWEEENEKASNIVKQAEKVNEGEIDFIIKIKRCNKQQANKLSTFLKDNGYNFEAFKC